jgi:cell division septation protein DedD
VVAIALAALALVATVAVAITLLLTAGGEDDAVAESQAQATTVIERTVGEQASPVQPEREQAPQQPAAAPEVQPEPTQGVSDWPRGDSGWTTILASMSTRERAEIVAGEADVAGVPEPGVLASDDHGSLTPGLWIVFSGQLSREEAAARAQDARSRGFGDAYPRFVSAE